MAEESKPATRPKSVLEDPSATAVARVYSEAFLNAAGDNPQEALEEFTSFMDDVLTNNPEFQGLITSPYFNRDEKRAMIERVMGRFASEKFTNFLRVLADHERLDLLPLILHQSHVMNEQRQGKRRVEVRTAVELKDDQLEKIRRQLNEQFSFEPVLVPTVDPSLIGGIVIQVGDTIYDSSLRSRMKQLAERLRQRSLHEIQSGRDRFGDPEGN